MEKKIIAHYGSRSLGDKIQNALKQAGKDLNNLKTKDLAIIDQLHTGGHMATLELAKKAEITPDMHILDAGCGIGGASRLLAEKYHCRVSGVDLVADFVDTARMLTCATALQQKIDFRQKDLLDLPFFEETFDCIWSQHSLMNIQDKERLFEHLSRLLKPGGRIVLHEVVQGSNSPIHLPVPWADALEISILETQEKMLSLLENLGFSSLYHQDCTEQAKNWWIKVKAANEKSKAAPRPLGPHLIFGDNGFLFGSTMTRNLDEDRIRIMEGVFLKSKS